METKAKIELTHSQKKELREIYYQYQSIRNDYETIEERKTARVELNEEYKTKFPYLISNGVDISDLPKHIYSKNQLLFIKNAEDEHDINYGYSGRGMYGDICPAVTCDSHNDLKTRANTVIDSMGRGIVIYAQY